MNYTVQKQMNYAEDFIVGIRDTVPKYRSICMNFLKFLENLEYFSVTFKFDKAVLFLLRKCYDNSTSLGRQTHKHTNKKLYL